MKAVHEIPVHERIDSLATRVKALEGWMEDFQIKWADAVKEVQANTALTEEIHGSVEAVKSEQLAIRADLTAVKGDTKAIREALKWMSTTKRVVVALIAAMTGFSGVVFAVAEAWKSFH